ncbi:response regulator transcription factor [Bradyrhizobium canariense]|uniref:response regulator transcription factor n=1 Tax=Bradyrhizobium canariense TaxID=255045 RepID=UPI00137477F0|nr:response regulator [Bradyrhizobium canariense]
MPQQQIIACIDDDLTVLEALQDFLDASGFVTVGFSSAEEFLASGSLRSASFLITDFKLGGMSGAQLLQRLSTLGVRIPAVLITAFPDEHVRSQGVAAGALSVMSKPVTMGDLVASIRNGNAAVEGRPCSRG